MTIRSEAGVRCLLTVTLSLACGGQGEGGLFGTVNDGIGEAGDPAAACSIVDDVLTLASEGTCALSAEQRALYGVRGAEPACRDGRIDFGGISGERVDLNGLRIRCEPPADAPAGGDTSGSGAPTNGVEQSPVTEGDTNNGAGGDATMGGTGTASDPEATAGDGAASEGPVPASAQWFQLQDEFSAGCDLVNGADFEAIVPSGGGRLLVVSRLNVDVTDFELPGLVLDSNYNAISDAGQEPVARIRYKEDADGGRRPWLIRPDGSAFGLDEDGTSPRNYGGVACQSCGVLDGADSLSCQAAIPQRIPSEGVSPGPDLIERSGVVADQNELQLLEWSDFDSRRGTTCGLLHGTDFKLAVSGNGLDIVPDRLDEDADPIPVEFGLSFFEFDDPIRGGTWHLVDAEGSVLGDLVFNADDAGELRLWFLGSDGSVLTRSFESSGRSPADLAPVACDPCSFFADPNGQCVPLSP